MKTGTFDEALEIIESFPDEQKNSLIEIVKLRLTRRTERTACTNYSRWREICSSAKSVRAQIMMTFMLEITQ